MSLYIVKKDKVLTMTRGDYFSFKVDLKAKEFPFEETTYTLGENDILYFGLMEPGQPFEKAFLKKEYTYDDYDIEGGTLKVVINPEDTIELEPGTYYYQIKVLYEDEVGAVHVDTVVQKTKFYIVD